MPANLPPEAQAKLAKYSEAKSIDEKIKALEEFISIVPKHKGTENLLLWAKRRLAELREELELQKRKRRSGGPRIFVEKEGAAQVVVIGPPNTGKSLLVNRLTGARTRVAEYPYSTTRPIPGMLRYEDVFFQLVDTPPLDKNGSQYNSMVVGLVRNADAIALVVGLDGDPLDQYLAVRELLAEKGILIEKPEGMVRIERGGEGLQFHINGKILDATINDVERLLARYRVYRARVYIEGNVTLDDIELAVIRPITYKPTIVIANKIDVPGAKERYYKLYNYLSNRKEKSVWLVPVSALKSINLDKLGPLFFKRLDLIRVYTKQPNGEPSETPLVLKRGATVYDVASRIHSDLVKFFEYARVWGPSAKYPGERVGLDHTLEDGDIVEIKARR
ncbi:MAG: TGS domain-containing protein [Pyrodictiaceae archaeon]